MPRSDDLYALPPGLPRPVDDGAADHLVGLRLPAKPLAATRGEQATLADQPGWLVIYCFPRTGQPDVEPLAGWNAIPGARGCTPQSCGYRDLHAELQQLGVVVFGLSTQTPAYQREAAVRLGLPFALLSDEGHEVLDALSLPEFEVEGTRLLRRLTLICRNGRIEHVRYPVFPPDADAAESLAWLETQRA